jgi:hypothetical protein
VIWTIFGIAVWTAVPLLCGWLGIEGLFKGTVRAKGGSYSRSESPRWFWAVVTMYLGLVAFWIYLTTRAVLGI